MGDNNNNEANINTLLGHASRSAVVIEDPYRLKVKLMKMKQGDYVQVYLPGTDTSSKSSKRLRVTAFCYPKDVIRNEADEVVSLGKAAAALQAGKELTWSKERAFGLVIEDQETQERVLLKDRGEDINPNLIAHYLEKQRHLPEAMLERREQGLQESPAAALANLIREYRFKSPRRETLPRKVDDTVLDALRKRSIDPNHSGDWTPPSAHETGTGYSV